jgi:hypothetical protein
VFLATPKNEANGFFIYQLESDTTETENIKKTYQSRFYVTNIEELQELKS